MRFSRLLLAVALVSVVACAPEEGAVIKKKGNGFELRIDGVPTFIKGVGGTSYSNWDVVAVKGNKATIKYNLPGGKLNVTLTRQEDNAVLTVTDTGVGLPEDALSHIFERFYRVDKARSRATGGSGLGLAIVWAIVQRNRGEITVDAVLNQGSTFTVTFPIFDTEEDDA